MSYFLIVFVSFSGGMLCEAARGNPALMLLIVVVTGIYAGWVAWDAQ